MSELKKKLEEALNLLEKANAAHPDSADTHIFQADARKALNEALSLLPEWVSAYPPERAGSYLVTDRTNVTEARYKPKSGEWVFLHAKKRIVVTDWQPLPAPPTMKENAR